MSNCEAATTRNPKDISMFVYEDALAAIFNNLPLMGAEKIAICDCTGRVLAEDIVSRVDVPACDVSAMDGYAVNSIDTSGVADGVPLKLRLASCVRAGERHGGVLSRGTAARIFTGAPLPAGSDAVIPQENADALDGCVLISEKAVEKQYVRCRGNDLRKGTKLFSSGHLLRAADAALIAGAGIARVNVGKLPLAGIITTGNELAAPGDPLESGMVFDANRYFFAARCAELKVMHSLRDIVRDDYDELKACVLNAADSCDLVATSGGTSVGEFDFMASLLEKEGKLVFWNARTKPRRPVVFGTLRGKPFFGLPGNTVSAMIGFEMFVKPALMKMMGASQAAPERIKAFMGNAYVENADRTRFTRGHLRYSSGKALVQALDPRETDITANLAETNCLIVMPADIDSYSEGDVVEVIMLR